MKKGTRLDTYLAEHGLSASREKARREILAGWVRVDGETVRQPSRLVPNGREIVVERPGGVFASRGGGKLLYALEYFAIDVAGRVVADLGASTGGFTDCLLQRGAALVYAVDVGYGQLDYRLGSDPRVVVMDRTNARHLTRDRFDRRVEFLTADLSFISVLKVIDTVIEVFSPIEGLLLIKPQFEAAGGEQKKGVVRKAEHHEAILARVIASLVGKGVAVRGLCYSPIKGPAGNIEFFLHFSAGIPGDALRSLSEKEIGERIAAVVEEAHARLSARH